MKDARETDKRPFIFLCLMALVIIGSIWIAFMQFSLPKAKQDSSPETEFSAHRARKHIAFIAQEPHPIGTLAQLKVSEYLESELRKLGLQVEVQTAPVVQNNPFAPHIIQAGIARNVLARLPGSSHKNSLALVAHYDSVPSSPGAVDDGASVAAIIETLRAIQAGKPLQNDIIAVFTDGEEVGLFGAQTFVEDHPWAEDIDLVMNFDTGGLHGPIIMLDNSEKAWLVKGAIQSVPRLSAYSVTFDVSKMLGSRTDMGAFKEKGMFGLDFVSMLDPRDYHTMDDSYERIDLPSLQHRGETILALTQHFGNRDLENPSQDDTVAFTLFPGIVIHYPAKFIWPISVFVSFCFIGLLILGFRKKRLKPGKLILSAFYTLIASAGTVVVVSLAWRLLQMLNGNYRTALTLIRGSIKNGDIVLVGILFLIIALISAAYALVRRKLGLLNLATAALLWWWILVIAASLFLPGTSYLFTWPALFGILALGLAFIIGDLQKKSNSAFFLFILLAFPVIILVAPSVYLFFTFFGFGAVGIPGTVFWGPIVALFFILVLPYMLLIAGQRKGLIPGSCFGLAIIILFIAILTSGFNTNQRLQNHILYKLNADTGEAFWIGGDTKLDSWTSQFFTEEAEKTTIDVIADDGFSIPSFKDRAPVIPLVPPNAIILNDQVDGDLRHLELNIHSPRKARDIVVQIKVKGEILEAAVNEKLINLTEITKDQKNFLHINYFGLSEEGFKLGLKVKSYEPVEILLDDRANDPPSIPGIEIKPRPPDMMPAASMTIDNVDGTRVIKSMIFPRIEK